MNNEEQASLLTSRSRSQRPTRQGGLWDFLNRQPQWLLLAVASGACAAFNGVFAKLTTTSLTTSWSQSISRLLSLSPSNRLVEFAIRAAFFGLNLLFNLAMWTLFTAALTRASSTTRVSIINVSANFMVTALLGLAIFGEKLPPMWWVGAGLLAAGNVVIGRREEGEKPGGTVGLERDEPHHHHGQRQGEEGETLLGEEIEGEGDIIDLDGDLTAQKMKAGEAIDDPMR